MKNAPTLVENRRFRIEIVPGPRERIGDLNELRAERRAYAVLIRSCKQIEALIDRHAGDAFSLERPLIDELYLSLLHGRIVDVDHVVRADGIHVPPMMASSCS